MEKNRIPLLDGWKFGLTGDKQAVRRDYDDSAWRTVDVPHDWQIEQPRREDANPQQGFFPREHIGVYRLHFTPDLSWQGKQVRILFDGVQHFSTVYLNDQEVGGRPYGYVPFLCDLTDALRFGEENVLAVWVDNSNPEGFTLGGADRWYSGAGIYRKVSWQVDGSPCRVRIDNGNAWSTLPFDAEEMPLHNGHILLIVQAGHEKGEARLRLKVEGLEERTLTFIFR